MTDNIHEDEDGQPTYSCCGMLVAHGHSISCANARELELLGVSHLSEYAGEPAGYLL